MAPDTLASFEKSTGINVHVSYFDTNETLEARMLTGSSGFDVVAPVAPYFQREIRSGAYLPLDKTKLPNLVNLDPAVMARVALNDAGNEHGIVYTWGTFGIGYNENRVARALPNVPFNSWRLMFDPEFAAKLATCGVNILDTPAGVVRLVLKYLGKDPNAPTPHDLADVETVLAKIRPYVRTIDSSAYIEALANGDICIALGYNGDVVQARKRATEAKNGINIDDVIPEEGSLLWFTMLAIPRGCTRRCERSSFHQLSHEPAGHRRHYQFRRVRQRNSCRDAAAQRLFVQLEDSPEQSRAITRIWQKFKTGQ